MHAAARQHLIAELAHADEEIRRLAVERTSELSVAEAMPLLVERLGDPSWRVRKAAVERMIDRNEPEPAVRALVGALADGENPGRRNAALEALTHFGADAVPVLVEASDAADVDVRKQAVDALGAIGHPSASPRLLALLADPDANVRAAAAEAVGGVLAPGAEAGLLARIEEDEEPLVRLCALRSLAKLRASVPVGRLADALADPLLRSAAFAVLGASGEREALEPLIKGLAASARSAREAAMAAIVDLASQLPPGAEASLQEPLAAVSGDFLADALERLRSAPLTTRLVLVQFLGLLARPDCVVPLLEASEDEALTEVVLGTLAEMGGAVEDALEADWPELPHAVRVHAARLMARTQGSAGGRLLRDALAAPDSQLRTAAANALAERGDAATLPALVAGLARAARCDPSDPIGEGEEGGAFEGAIARLVEPADAGSVERVAVLLEAQMEGAPEGYRLAVARLLGRFGRVEHVGRVELLLSDPAPEVRRAAVEAVARIAPDRVDALRCALADEAPRVRVGAATALGGARDPSVMDDLAALAVDADGRVAGAALRAVAHFARANDGEAQRTRAFELLGAAIRRQGTTALAAIEALDLLGGADAVGLAFEALAGPEPEVVEAAVACVGRHGDREALGELLDCLGHEAWNVRARAVQVQRERRNVRAIPAILRHLERERDEFVRQAALAALHTLESH